LVFCAIIIPLDQKHVVKLLIKFIDMIETYIRSQNEQNE
jgi:hypothetical protein